ncbi:hypothetical protein [Acinetobacter haemolyticus]|uniref:hypothetical protein n=1 Tax=Acinetobacter haemolyticus TaxID=29430 RepID=UPI000D68EB50|nr:hypothetical protein [Acinetobacter haemolyticus]
MSTTFIDTNGEMSFEDNERLKFVIHYLKQGASEELIKTDKNGRFVNEDSETAFTDIWLASAQHQQSKVDELQKQLINQGQRFNEQSQRIKDLEHKSGELQKRVEFLEMNLHFVKEHFEMNDLDKAMPRVYEELEQALKGEG